MRSTLRGEVVASRLSAFDDSPVARCDSQRECCRLCRLPTTRYGRSRTEVERSLSTAHSPQPTGLGTLDV